MSFIFDQKQNVRAFIIVLGMTMKAVAFKSLPEINRFVKKLVIFFVINLPSILIASFLVTPHKTHLQSTPFTFHIATYF